MSSLPEVVEDLHGVLKLHSDGSISRAKDMPLQVMTLVDESVAWKDFQYDERHGLFLRLYKPKTSGRPSRSPPSNDAQLPVVYFFHGGGFCVGSRTWPHYHNTCQRLASTLHALVVAPDYRLAPEHRLPAALDDALTSLKWLQAQAISDNKSPDDIWLENEKIHYGKVFIIGDSSGGNMAHHLAMQLGVNSPELSPVRVRGYVLMAPFFGGTERTKSEAEGQPEPLLNLETLDRFWRLALPLGKNADHPFANPFGPTCKSLESVQIDPMLVMAGGNEVMRDRIENYAMKLKGLGKKVDYVEFEGQHHGFLVNDPYSELGSKVLGHIKDMMNKISG